MKYKITNYKQGCLACVPTPLHEGVALVRYDGDPNVSEIELPNYICDKKITAIGLDVFC